jgi:hypothetical protein
MMRVLSQQCDGGNHHTGVVKHEGISKILAALYAFCSSTQHEVIAQHVQMLCILSTDRYSSVHLGRLADTCQLQHLVYVIQLRRLPRLLGALIRVRVVA